MDFEEIKQILALVKEHELAEFELAHQDFKIRIRKDTGVHALAAAPVPVAPLVAAPAPQAAVAPGPVAPAVEDGDELAVVKSPIVGTFYHAAEPGAPPFVSVGEAVRKGQVLCLIEAMKLMNEIESEYDGEIVKAYVENGKPVQFGERLFAIKAT
ncbi:MAG: acetyl-CoA carboxylase biotin carboxyl carrier protein [Vicinamibacteria bacterium]|nr:acetyl-CoA carboxylase biotin carboxyl carrier protein [Vicinamibacteria bacterium]